MEIAEKQCRRLFKERIRQFSRKPPTSPDELSEKMYCIVMENILARILAGTNPYVSDKDRETAHKKILQWKKEVFKNESGTA